MRVRVCVCMKEKYQVQFLSPNKVSTQKMMVMMVYENSRYCDHRHGLQPALLPPTCPSGFCSVITSSGHIALSPATPVWIPHRPACSTSTYPSVLSLEFVFLHYLTASSVSRDCASFSLVSLASAFGKWSLNECMT